MSCYAHAAYHEAGTQQEIIAVMNVIRQRIKAGYGKDSCEVAYAAGQFQGITDPSHDEVDKKRYLEIKSLAVDAIVFNKHKNPVPKKLHFYDETQNGKSVNYGHIHSELKEAARVTVSQATWLKVNEPHLIENFTDNVRLTLSLRFKELPERFRNLPDYPRTFINQK
jgi:hypothetical protein